MRAPKHFGWRSIRGIENRGTYALQAISNETRVGFTMEYQLVNPLMEAALAPPVEPLMAGQRGYSKRGQKRA